MEDNTTEMKIFYAFGILFSSRWYWPRSIWVVYNLHGERPKLMPNKSNATQK